MGNTFLVDLIIKFGFPQIFNPKVCCFHLQYLQVM